MIDQPREARDLIVSVLRRHPPRVRSGRAPRAADRTTAVVVSGATLFDGRIASPRRVGAGAQPVPGVARRAGASEGRAGVGDDAAGRSARSAVEGLADGTVVLVAVLSGRVEGAGVGRFRPRTARGGPDDRRGRLGRHSVRRAHRVAEARRRRRSARAGQR
ncbi:hypothetical protein, partial [Streptomyces scabiei]|uniref:hypothetical protein n=1 Tax=Streptomyces scabiei TaxID=1930 RepID=UPI001F40AD81